MGSLFDLFVTLAFFLLPTLFPHLRSSALRPKWAEDRVQKKQVSQAVNLLCGHFPSLAAVSMSCGWQIIKQSLRDQHSPFNSALSLPAAQGSNFSGSGNSLPYRLLSLTSYTQWESWQGYTTASLLSLAYI